MVDLSQWRACIGLWNSCKTAACRSTQIFHPNLCKTVARDKISSVISLYLIAALVYISSAILGFLSNVASLLFPGIIASCSSAHFCLVLAGGSASILVCIFLYLIVHLLLFLSGDIELNPGPLTDDCDPKEILRKCSDKLIDAISTTQLTLLKVTNGLYAKQLIPQITKEEMMISTITPYEKATKLVNAVEKQLKASLDPCKYLLAVVYGLRNQGNRALTDLVNSISGQSDEIEPYPDCVKEYADILKQRHYKKLSIIGTDWPPKVGNDDVFGRLALIQQNDNSPQENNSPQNETSTQQKESSDWYLLRGQVDEIYHLTGNVKLNIEDILKPTKDFLSLVVLIDGPPGIGKTTLCRKLLHMWSDGELIPHYDLVLYCPLRNEKIAEAKTLADLFVHQRHNVPEIVDLFKERNGEGMLIIFDGWDELSTKLRESSLAAGIIRREQLDQCSVIVTSRSYASSSLIKMSSLNKHVHVIGFSKDEIAKVIIQTLQKDKTLAQELLDEISIPRWYVGFKKVVFLKTSRSNEESQLAVKLINDLKKRSDVESLCFIPFICSIVISVYCKEKQLKTTLTELYENFILQTIKRQIEKQGCSSYVFNSLSSLPVELAEPFEEICEFAYTNLANNNKDPVLTFVSHQIMGMSAAKNNYFGLLTTFIDHEEKYQFIHLTIQEFLAAWWIAKQPNSEEIFKTHFDNEHFRLCLRFVAGLTNLSHEHYKQYFNKPIDLKCKTKRLFGFDTRYQSYFYINPTVDHVRHDNFLTCVDHFPILLLHLLYESQNEELCQALALSISPQSICLHALEFSLFDILCLNYFLNVNSTTYWNHLHLMPLYQDELSVLTTILNTNRLDVHFYGLTNDTILQLRNVRECYVEVSGFILYTCDVLVQLLSFSQIKILHLKINEIIEKYNMEHCCCSDLKKCLAEKTTLQEFNVDHKRTNRSQNADIQGKVAIHEKNIFNAIIKGICKNTSITFLSLQFDINTYFTRQWLVESELMESDLMECDLMKRLFKENKTLRALSGTFVPLRILETINTPLVATDGNSFIPGLECILLSKLHPSHVINPSLVVTGLTLDSPESAIELFDILKTDTKLKALRLFLTPEEFSFTLIFKIMSTSMKEMLQENHTLECLEINTGLDILPFFSCLVTGLEKNETLKQLSLPIPLSTSCMYNKNDDVKNLFSLLACKKNLTELQLYFQGHNPGHTIIATDDDTIFQIHVLPMIINMLLSNGKIEVLSINIQFFGSPMHNNAWEKFINAIFNHPSLQHVVLKLHFQSTEWKEFLRGLVKELKKASPIIICETDYF